MKKSLLLFYAILICSVCTVEDLLAQSENFVCGTPSTTSSMMAAISGNETKNKLLFVDPNPVGRNFKVAALYFKENDDTFDGTGTTFECEVSQWPTDSAAPNWLGELLISTPFNAVTVDTDTAAKPNSLTTYFYRISGGNLWLYGDEVAYTGTPINNTTSKTQWRSDNESVLQWYIDNHDLSSLDNNSDGYVDMIIFISRARTKFPYGSGSGTPYQGVADGDYLPSSIEITGAPNEPKIRGDYDLVKNSGVYQTDCYSRNARYIIAHELGHQLMQAGHFNRLHRWNLMSGAGSTPPTMSGLVLSAYEKSRLNWITLTDITDDRVCYELEDLTSSNQAVRIPVSGTNNYFLLEHRMNIVTFETIPDPDCGTTAGLAEGLLVSYSSGSEPDIRPADNNVAWADPPTNSKKDGDATDLFPNGGITEITPFTTPDTDDHLGNSTGIAITNIHYEGDNIVFNIYQNYHTGAWSGNVTSNTAWGGNVTINSDVTVQSGVTLYIDAGAAISFASGSTDLWVEGQIIAEGTSSNPITFTASAANPQPSEWGTIFVESDDNVFEHCTVEYSDLGIKIYDTTYLTGNVVKNCTIENNDQGLRFQNADVTVENNTIRDNTLGAVTINADGLFTFPFLRNMLS